jgi:hypothetical protein
MLVAKLIAKRPSELQASVIAFMTKTQIVRELRNLADHLDTRIDQVLSCNLPAIGRLSWVTMLSTRAALVGVLEPGTLRTQRKAIQLPFVGERPIRPATGAIQLTSGPCSCWLDDIMAALSELIAAIEQNVEYHVVRNSRLGQKAPRNMLLLGQISFEEVEPTQPTNDPQPWLL